MSSKHDPADCLVDIIENAERVASYIAGMDRPAFDADQRTRDAVERCVERVCEAAYRRGDQATVLMPDQPWAKIRGMGNRLRHGYDGVVDDVVWDTATSTLPFLLTEARVVLARLGDELGP